MSAVDRPFDLGDALRRGRIEIKSSDEGSDASVGVGEPVTVELCGAIFPARAGQDPCRKPKGHENGPDTDWKRDLHSNGLLKWRVDGADLPWRFDVPEVPDSVTCVKEVHTGRLWVLRSGGWLRWNGGITSGALLLGELLAYAPLVECEDPRGAS